MDPMGFDEVREALVGSIAPELGQARTSAHRGGVKVWFGDSKREHYEAQLIRLDGDIVLEIGFHAEHAKPADNDAAIATLVGAEKAWRRALGDDPVVGPFLGRPGWARVSETWPAPGFEDIDEVIEVAARLADYVNALEPVRRAGLQS
jgi:hypothetical protein